MAAPLFRRAHHQQALHHTKGRNPDFYDRAVQALEDGEDIRAAAATRQEAGGVSHKEFTSDPKLD
ncbi:hypothetical protein QQO25_10240 [Corynebacterium lehmanniae]|nr:hypothetical protein [Corynebacterium lehmanniae]